MKIFFRFICCYRLFLEHQWIWLIEPLPQARSKFWMELRWYRILLNITWELDLIEKTLIWICTTVMGSNQTWQSRQLLIRCTLFGAPFLAPSQFMGEQYSLIKVSLLSYWGAAEVIDCLISNNIDQHPKLLPICELKTKYFYSPRPLPVTFYSFDNFQCNKYILNLT